jgi:cytochrome c biogenesis protein CcmG/thiol:disulfide interchange protein DsbE
MDGNDDRVERGATGPGVDVAALDGDVPANSSRKAGIITLVAVLALLAVILVVALAPKGKPADGILPADPTGYAAPALSLDRLDGNGKISLADLKGQPVVINFWASWCVTCKEEAPVVAAAEKRWRDKGVVFLGIDALDKDDAARAFEQQYGFEYDSVVDPEGTTANAWRVTAYPESFFIGRDGRIVSAVRNAVDEATIDENISLIAG